MRAPTVVSSFVAVLAILAGVTPAGAQDLSGAWTVRGRDRDGAYRGTATLGQVGATIQGRMDLEPIAIGPDGVARPRGLPRRRVRLAGRIVGGTLRASRTLEPGLAGLIAAAPASGAVEVIYALRAGRLVAGGAGLSEVLLAVPPGAAPPGPAGDEDRPGDWGAPLSIPSLPFVHAGTTAGRRSLCERYAPSPQTSEAGPEVVYRLDVAAPGRLRAEVEGDRDPVDIDIHVLRTLTLDPSGAATGGLARSNRVVEVDVDAGPVFIAVDTFQAARRAGPYVLRVDLAPRDGFRERPIAQGVTLRTKVDPDLFGGKQTVSVLAVDVHAPGVSVRPIQAQGCATTSALAEREGCVAAINGGFFGDGCRSLSLVRIDGALRATNARDRSAIGFDARGLPSITLVPAGRDWPEVRHALGGIPRLLERGAVVVTPGAEESSPAFATSRHPRTAVGITPGGDLLLATFDGRTDAGAGLSLADLASWFQAQGAVDALNLDGGGSTTLWVRGEGVINYPSDDHRADHEGQRAVSTVLGVWAAPLDRDALWLTTPPAAERSSGEPWSYEAVVDDPEMAQVRFHLEGPVPGGPVPPGLVLEDRGDGTCRLAWPAVFTSGTAASIDLTLVAEVAGSRPARQPVTIRRR